MGSFKKLKGDSRAPTGSCPFENGKEPMALGYNKAAALEIERASSFRWLW